MELKVSQSFWKKITAATMACVMSASGGFVVGRYFASQEPEESQSSFYDNFPKNSWVATEKVDLDRLYLLEVDTQFINSSNFYVVCDANFAYVKEENNFFREYNGLFVGVDSDCFLEDINVFKENYDYPLEVIDKDDLIPFIDYISEEEMRYISNHNFELTNKQIEYILGGIRSGSRCEKIQNEKKTGQLVKNTDN